MRSENYTFLVRSISEPLRQLLAISAGVLLELPVEAVADDATAASAFAVQSLAAGMQAAAFGLAESVPLDQLADAAPYAPVDKSEHDSACTEAAETECRID
mmetsp:Transcript_51632/g.92743  ORF Transcript_51632/g.92743 Transcript_51632/m.92743 type:complete len:101 (+) Transcript_51632:69-371(+)